jgi:integrase
MPRAKKSDSIDLSERRDLTADVLERLACRPGREQDFLRDADRNGLRVRVTAAGAKAFVFEKKVSRRTVRWTIGDVRAWSIPAARQEARRLAALVDQGIDPREQRREQEAAKAAEVERKAAEEQRRANEAAAEAAREARLALTVREAWGRYVAEQRALVTGDGPQWGERHYRDHLTLAQEGGTPRRRGKDKVTQPGPLSALMPLRLVDLTSEAVEEWAKREVAVRPARARLALRLLKAFLRWAAADKELKDRVDPVAASGKKARLVLGKPRARADCLQRDQLPAWFEHVRKIQNPVIAAYLQCLLLTGARREELASLRWESVDLQWRSMELRDKIERTRQVPITPFVAYLLSTLPRRNEWVFPSARELSLEAQNRRRRGRYHARIGGEAPAGPVVVASASGRLVEPSIAHRKACAAAGVPSLTLHGLRRSFGSFSEWVEMPTGIAAQVMGHAPSATAEKHYRVREVDLLRLWHSRLEAWILEQGGVPFDPQQATQAVGLRVVGGAKAAA